MTTKTALAAKAGAKPPRKGPAPAARKAHSARRKKGGAKAAEHGTRPDGLRPGSKMATMLDMALRPGGATEQQICKAIGWQKCRVTLKRAAEKTGAVLTQSRPDPDGPLLYKATMPPKKGT